MLKFIRQSYGEFNAARAIGPVEWPHHDLFFVHQGEVTLEFPSLRRTLRLKQGTGVLIWPCTHFRGHANTRSARASIHHFQVDSAPPRALPRLARQRHGVSLQLAPPSRWLEACVEQSQEMARSPGDEPGLDPRRQLLLALILAEGGYFPRKENASAKRIDLAVLGAWLRENLRHRPGVNGIAKCAGLSLSRFRSVFVAEHAMTAGEFLLSVREAEAKRLLLETMEPLKAIADVLGYADAVVLNRAFKQRTGVTPAAFRRRHRIIG